MLKTLSELYKYLIPYRSKLILGIGLLVFSVIFEVVNPKILGLSIDELNSESINLNTIILYALLILGIMLIRGVILYYQRYILIGTSRRVEYDIRNKLYKHLLKLEPKFFDKNQTGDIISRMTSDLEQIRMIYGPGIMYLCNVILLFTLSLILMLSIDITLTLLSLLPMVLLAYLIKVIGKSYFEKSTVVQEELAQMTTFVNDNLQGIRVIKSYVKEAFIMDAFHKISLTFIRRNISLAKLSGIFRPILMFIAGISSILVLWMGGLQVARGEMTLGTLIEFLAYIEILSMPLMALGWVIAIFQRGKAAYVRINKILMTEPEITDKQVLNYITDLKGDINFKNLSFSYKGTDQLVLKDVTFNIKKGEKVAIIGPTGSGKTTLVSLLLRLYEPPPLSIFVDQVPIDHIPLKTLRSHIGYVLQEDFIFPDTILENIRFGSNGQNDFSKIVEMAKLAQLENEIESFPNHYEELIGERGVTLSGGQRQRLGIARMLSAEPNIIIFDDSFSNIDSDTEKRILSNIHNNYKEQTVIIIAHRASTIQNVDKIVVIDQGYIKEIGTPEKLIKQNGYYAHLLKREMLSHDLKDLA